MVAGNKFTARVLEGGASGLAGYAVAAMLAESPQAEDRWGPGALDIWKTHLTQRVLELAATVEAGQPEVFVTRVLWSRQAFAARGHEPDDIRLSLEALRRVTGENLPPDAAATVAAYIDQAIAALASDPKRTDSSPLDPSRPHERMALAYLQTVLEGESRRALQELERARADGMPALEIISSVLLPAQREIGRLWHLGKASIADEHMVSAVTRRALTAVVTSTEPAEANGKTLIAAAVAGNAHDLSVRAVADAFELSGWRVIYLGADVPTEELLRTVVAFEADLLLLSAMLATQLTSTRRTIETVRAHAGPKLRILVGGAVFDEAPEAWKSVGADGSAGSLEEAIRRGARLVGLDGG